MRTFNTGATRSSATNKNSYYGFRNPLVELSFANYMRKHTIQEDGKVRDANNWWKGWDKEISLQSLIRHTEDLQAICAGYYVYEINGERVYTKKEIKGHTSITEEDCLNAIRFNTGAYLLEIL